MKTAKLGDILKWKGKLVEVRWINEGHKSIGMVSFEDKLCPHCHKPIGKYEVEHIESSALFQESAEPVKTIEE